MPLYVGNVMTGEIIAIIDTIEKLDTLSTENCCVGIDLSTKEDMTASFTCTVDRLALLSVLYGGKRITNNWLKYHGQVLRRKRHRR